MVIRLASVPSSGARNFSAQSDAVALFDRFRPENKAAGACLADLEDSTAANARVESFLRTSVSLISTLVLIPD